MRNLIYKSRFQVSILIILACNVSFGATEKRVSSNIEHVNVYLNRAQVKRSAQASVQPGITDIILTGLTTKLDVNSIQVNGKGKFILMSVKHQTDFINKNQSSDKAKSLQTQIDQYLLDEKKLNQQMTVLVEEKDMLLQNRKIGGDDNGVSSLELEKISIYYRKRRMEIDDEYIGASEKLRLLQIKRSDAENQLYELNRNANTSSSNIVVSISSDIAQTISLDFDYIVFNAGWIPYYDIRATEGKNNVQLSYKAQIYQSTDIDWKNVSISVSTGNPAQGGNKPNLNPWYLNIYNAYSTNQGLSNGRYGKKSEDKYDWGDAEGSSDEFGAEELDNSWSEAPVAESTTAYTSVSESNLAATFDIALKQTIPSDNKKYTVDIRQLDVDATFEHSAVPKLDPDAFLMAQLTNWESYNLLSGSANVFYNGAFVGNTYMDMASTSDTLGISLGRDKKVIITREKIKDFCKTKNLGSNIKKTVGYEITIKNSKKEIITLSLEDHYPISGNSEIEVSLLEKSGAKETEQGKLNWEIKLDPGETKKIVLKFEVKYPKKISISNL